MTDERDSILIIKSSKIQRRQLLFINRNGVILSVDFPNCMRILIHIFFLLERIFSDLM